VAELETVILDLLEGQYKDPVRVVSLNTAEKWSQDVSADVAREIRQRCDLQLPDVPFSCRILWAVTKAGIAISNFPCRCAWSDHGPPLSPALLINAHDSSAHTILSPIGGVVA
jgi:hypothetical protein